MPEQELPFAWSRHIPGKTREGSWSCRIWHLEKLLVPLFLVGCFQAIFEKENGPLGHSGKRPIKVGKRPIKEGKRPIKVNGLFSDTPPYWKTAPLERPIKRSMNTCTECNKPSHSQSLCISVLRERTPPLQALLFSISLPFCCAVSLLCFAFSLPFPRGLGFREEKSPFFFRGFPCFFYKKARVGGSGNFPFAKTKFCHFIRKTIQHR